MVPSDIQKSRYKGGNTNRLLNNFRFRRDQTIRVEPRLKNNILLPIWLVVVTIAVDVCLVVWLWTWLCWSCCCWYNLICCCFCKRCCCCCFWYICCCCCRKIAISCCVRFLVVTNGWVFKPEIADIISQE